MTSLQSESLFTGFPAVTLEQWKSRVIEELKGGDYERIVWKTPDGFSVEPWYNSQSAQPAPTVPNNRASNRWRISQLITVDDPHRAAMSARDGIAGGADCIEFRLADTRFCSMEHLRVLLQGIDLPKIPLFFSGALGDPAALVGNLLQLPGFCANTGAILHDGQKSLPASLQEHALYDAGRACAAEFRLFAVNTEPYHLAGASITQEIAIALAGLSDLLCRLKERGMNPADAAAKTGLVVATGASHFPELAKMRVLRALWPKVLEAFGITADEAPAPEILARTSLRNASMLDPYTNILRLSTEAVSAILGGCDTLQIGSFDPAGTVSPELAERITRNIHLLLREESGLDRVVDPAAGSWYLDTLTATLSREAWKIFLDIEAAGGLAEAEEQGLIGAMIAPVAESRIKEVRTRKRSLIGVNRYAVPPAAEITSDIERLDALAESSLESSDTAEFERLRINAVRCEKNNGRIPKVTLWLHGEPSKSFRVAAFAEDFFRCGGFNITGSRMYDLSPESCREVLQENPDIVILCWTGKEDIESVAPICSQLHELSNKLLVVMASKPPKNAGLLLEAGLEAFINTESDLCASLVSFQSKTGMA